LNYIGRKSYFFVPLKLNFLGFCKKMLVYFTFLNFC